MNETVILQAQVPRSDLDAAEMILTGLLAAIAEAKAQVDAGGQAPAAPSPEEAALMEEIAMAGQ